MSKGSGLSNEKSVDEDKKGGSRPDREPLVSFSLMKLPPVPAVIFAMARLPILLSRRKHC